MSTTGGNVNSSDTNAISLAPDAYPSDSIVSDLIVTEDEHDTLLDKYYRIDSFVQNYVPKLECIWGEVNTFTLSDFPGILSVECDSNYDFAILEEFSYEDFTYNGDYSFPEYISIDEDEISVIC